MAEDPDVLVAQWRFDDIETYLDVDAGAPVEQGERLSVLNTEDTAIALTAAEMRVEAIVSTLPDRELAKVAVTAVDRLYRAGTTMSLWSPDIASYVKVTWGSIFKALKLRGYRVHYVVEHDHPERIGRPLELYPDLFAAAGFAYACPYVFANDLPEALDAEVTPEALAPFLKEGRTMAAEQAEEFVKAGRHLAYVEAAPDEGAVDAVLAQIDLVGGTIGVHRVGEPTEGSPPDVIFASRGPGG